MRLPRTGLMPFLKRHLYPIYFARKLLEEGTQQLQLIKTLEKKGSAQHLLKGDLRGATGRTAFILGSGVSVNEYGPDHWRIVSDGYSVGMNWWLLHDFVPDAYSIEHPLSKEELKNEGPCHLLSYDKLLNLRADDYRNTLLLCRGPYQFKHYLREGVPTIHQGRIKTVISLNLLGETQEEMSKSADCFGYVLRLNRKIPLLRHFLLPGLSASILFYVTLFYVAGVKSVVLCGVDLNHNRYFFQEDVPGARRASEAWPVPQLGDTSRAHVTYTVKINVIDRLLAIQKSLAREGFQIYSGTPNSALVPHFPVYPWTRM